MLVLLNFLLSLLSTTHVLAATTPVRIVTLAPVIAEWTAEILGKDDAIQKLVGTSEYSDYPKELSRIHSVGPYPQLNIEKIASLNPTLVIASSEYNRPDQLEKLARLKLRVEVLPAEKFFQMESWLRKLGLALGEVKKAEKAIEKWNQGRDSIKRVKGRRVLIQVQETPIIVVGGQSFLSDAFESLGYSNVFARLKQAYPKVSREAVLKEDPDLIFLIDMGSKTSGNPSVELGKKWKELDRDVRVVSGDDFARCSLRLLNALKQLQ
jgi:iron complex transport system substrate-binding protein